MIPEKFGLAAGTTEDQPVKSKDDWPRVQKLMAQYDVTKTDPRMAGCLEVIKNVSAAVGDQMPLVPMYYVGTTAAMFLFRPNEAFLEDTYDDPDWVAEMRRRRPSGPLTGSAPSTRRAATRSVYGRDHGHLDAQPQDVHPI